MRKLLVTTSHDMVVFVARDKPNRAMSVEYELILETDRLQEFQIYIAAFSGIGMTFIANKPTSHGVQAVD